MRRRATAGAARVGREAACQSNSVAGEGHALSLGRPLTMARERSCEGDGRRREVDGGSAHDAGQQVRRGRRMHRQRFVGRDLSPRIGRLRPAYSTRLGLAAISSTPTLLPFPPPLLSTPSLFRTPLAMASSVASTAQEEGKLLTQALRCVAPQPSASSAPPGLARSSPLPAGWASHAVGSRSCPLPRPSLSTVKIESVQMKRCLVRHPQLGAVRRSWLLWG